MRIDRMLSIIIYLLNNEKVIAKDLAKKFEVSVRTIYRDIEAINDAGIPIVPYSGYNGGFSIMENYKIDRRFFSLDDMLSILSTLKGINSTLEDEKLDQAIGKLKSLVPKDKKEKLDDKFEQINIDFLPWGNEGNYINRFKIIRKSISSNRLLKFIYRNSKGEILERTIEPMTLIFKGFTWYLFGYCRVKEDYRIFRLSRMKKIEMLSMIFKRREKSYKQLDDAFINNSKMVELVLSFSSKAKVMVEDYFNEEQIEVQNNGDLVVRATYPEDEWVYSLILSFGDNVEIIKPEHIRKIIRKKTERMLKNLI